MTNKPALTHEILRFVTPMKKGRQLADSDLIACANLILALEEQRRRLETVVMSAQTALEQRDNDWNVVVSELKKENTQLRKRLKDNASMLRSLAVRAADVACHSEEVVEKSRTSLPSIRLPK